jgi:NAD(P)H-nitrite reductase large subunit
LLGLETAYALHKMGLTVWVLERGEWLLRRQLDERGGQALKQYLEALGLIVETSVETEAVHGEDCVSQISLKDGRTLPCDLFLMAAGIQPNVDLAQAAGLNVNRGIVVDEAMRTSALDIFAAGDACEFSGQVPGLWAVAVEQAKVAAMNAVGSQVAYDAIVPVTMLKVAGADLVSAGRIETQSSSEIEIAQHDLEGHGYRKLVVSDGRLVGAILFGDPQNMPIVTAAVKDGREVSQCLDALYAGQWDVLGDAPIQPAASHQTKWVMMPASNPEPVPGPIAEPAPAGKPRPQAVHHAVHFPKVDWRATSVSRSLMARRTPASHAETATVKSNTLRPGVPPATGQAAEEPVLIVKPPARILTIIYKFSRERTDADAKR